MMSEFKMSPIGVIRRRAKRINIPNGARAKYCCAVFSGRIIEKNLDPSNGGTGIRFKNPSAKLNLINRNIAGIRSGIA